MVVVTAAMQRSSIEKNKWKMMTMKTKTIRRKEEAEEKKEHTYKKEMRPIFVLCSLVFVFGGSKKKKYRNL